jgi:hypothetical protein
MNIKILDYELLKQAVSERKTNIEMSKMFNCSAECIRKNLKQQGLYDEYIIQHRIPYSEYVTCDICGREIPWSKKASLIIDGQRTILCGKHYMQYINKKCFLDNEPKSCADRNDYEFVGDGVWIYTYYRDGKPSGKFIIDKEDFENVIKRKWRKWGDRYFTGNSDATSIHQFLMNAPEDMVIDHIDNDPSNNRRNNLRVTKQSKNAINKVLQGNNTSEIAGVWFDKARNKWSAEIKMSGIKCYLGRYDNKCDAVYARYCAEIKLFKEFRCIRNDENIMKLVDKCNNKEYIGDYVMSRLQNKYSLFENIAS